jgi:hypothetical protein
VSLNRLPKVVQAGQFFSSYQKIAGIEATDAGKAGKLQPLRMAMKSILNIPEAKTPEAEDGTLDNWLKSQEALYDLLMLELKEAQTYTASAARKIKSEVSCDRFMKSIAATRAHQARPIYTALNKMADLKDENKDDWSNFQRTRLADFAEIQRLHDEIRNRKTERLEKLGKISEEDLLTLEESIQTRVKTRNDLLIKHVKFGDPKAICLATEMGALETYRDLADFKSECPFYVAPTFDEYYFKHVIKGYDHRNKNERTLAALMQNALTGSRERPQIPDAASATADGPKEQKTDGLKPITEARTAAMTAAAKAVADAEFAITTFSKALAELEHAARIASEAKLESDPAVGKLKGEIDQLLAAEKIAKTEADAAAIQADKIKVELASADVANKAKAESERVAALAAKAKTQADEALKTASQLKANAEKLAAEKLRSQNGGTEVHTTVGSTQKRDSGQSAQLLPAADGSVSLTTLTMMRQMQPEQGSPSVAQRQAEHKATLAEQLDLDSADPEQLKALMEKVAGTGKVSKSMFKTASTKVPAKQAGVTAVVVPEAQVSGLAPGKTS